MIVDVAATTPTTQAACSGGIHIAAGGRGEHVAAGCGDAVAAGGGAHAAAGSSGGEVGRGEMKVLAGQSPHGTVDVQAPAMVAATQASTSITTTTMTTTAPEAPKVTIPPNTNASNTSFMINDIPESSHQGNKKSKGKPF